jgi:hypothetical protein
VYWAFSVPVGHNTGSSATKFAINTAQALWVFLSPRAAMRAHTKDIITLKNMTTFRATKASHDFSKNKKYAYIPTTA